MKKFLVISSRDYSNSNRGMDILIDALLKYDNVDMINFFNIFYKLFNKNFNIGPVKFKINDNVLSKTSPISLGIPYINRVFSWVPNTIFNLLKYQTKNTYPKINFNNYENIILESGKPVFLIESIPNNSKLIYRQSDPIELILSKNKNYIELEHKVLEKADLILTVNNNIMNFYKNNYPHFYKKMILWKNGFQIPKINENTNPYKSYKDKKNAVFMGLFNIDKKLINFIANQNPDIIFHIIGPYNRLNLKWNQPNNVKYHGYMKPQNYISYIKHADFAFIPYQYKKSLEWFGMTSKFYLFMYFKLPIISVDYGNLKNCLHKSIYLAENKKDFNSCINLIRNNDFRKINYNINFDFFSKFKRSEKIIEIFKKNKIL